MAQGSVVMVETVTRHRFSVDDYHRMVEAGILTQSDRVELLYGQIVMMAPIGIPHAYCVDRLLDIFSALRPRVHLRIQGPATLPTCSEPEPDLTVARPRSPGYFDRHPHPSDILLVVEVAETSLKKDREVKAPLYAEKGIAEYWIVNIPDGVIEVHSDPRETGYGNRRILGRGESLAPEAFPDFKVAVNELLPPLDQGTQECSEEG